VDGVVLIAAVERPLGKIERIEAVAVPNLRALSADT
jgi:hypothetical protein